MDSQYRQIIRRIKSGLVSDPTMTGKILNKPGGRLHKFCCDTGCSTNVMPARLAALNGLEWYPVDRDEPSYRSVTNQRLEVIGQTQCFIKLQKLRNPVKLSFLVVMDDSDESLLSLDTLKDLSIVPKAFPNLDGEVCVICVYDVCCAFFQNDVRDSFLASGKGSLS